MSAKTQITHDASVQRDHSDMIVHVTMQITFWMRPIQRLNDNHTLQVHLHCPQDGRIRMTWVLKSEH